MQSVIISFHEGFPVVATVVDFFFGAEVFLGASAFFVSVFSDFSVLLFGFAESDLLFGFVEDALLRGLVALEVGLVEALEVGLVGFGELSTSGVGEPAL